MQALVPKIQAIEALASKADEATKNSILNKLRDLQYRIESPIDTFLGLYNSHLRLAVVYIAMETRVFTQLSKDGARSLTAQELVTESGASSDLIDRILRYLASIGFISNSAPSQYQANKLTHFLASPMAHAGIIHSFDTMGPAIQAFPSFLAGNKYQEITDNTNTPFQKGHKTPLAAFAYLQGQPRLFGALQSVMTAITSDGWLDGLEVLDLEARQVSKPSDEPCRSESPFFVDIGGGHGHQSAQLLGKYPALASRLVLQDLPQAIDRITSLPAGIIPLAHDFFTPQPETTHGTKFFYLRRILHDWPDEDCLRILSHLRDAMSEIRGETRILIDEIVLPDIEAPWQAAMADISMGLLFGGKERTRKQWEELVKKGSLIITAVTRYSASSCHSVIFVERP